jgi:hypothetical protein
MKKGNRYEQLSMPVKLEQHQQVGSLTPAEAGYRPQCESNGTPMARNTLRDKDQTGAHRDALYVSVKAGVFCKRRSKR